MASTATFHRTLRMTACFLLILIGGCVPPPVELPPQVEVPCTTADCICKAQGEATTACICARNEKSDLCHCADEQNQSTPRCCNFNPNFAGCTKPLVCPAGDTIALIRGSLKHVDGGEWEEAERYIACAHKQSPDNSRAALIHEQLELGEDYFTAKGVLGRQPYEVQSGDTLGTIARDCLGNTDLFVALTLYNRLERADTLAPGHMLNLPGNKACAAARDWFAEARTASEAGNIPLAWDLIQKALRADKRQEVKDFHEQVRHARADQLIQQGFEIMDSNCPKAKILWREAKKVRPEDEDIPVFLNDVVCD